MNGHKIFTRPKLNAMANEKRNKILLRIPHSRTACKTRHRKTNSEISDKEVFQDKLISMARERGVNGFTKLGISLNSLKD